MTTIKSSETEEMCNICHCEMSSDKKMIHRDMSESRKKRGRKIKWTHQFCTECIDIWIKSCISKNKTPNCPLCPDFNIPKKKFPIAKKDTDYEMANGIAITRFNNYAHHHRTPVFMGIMICMNDACILKLTNNDIIFENRARLHGLSSMAHIKEWILTKNYDVYCAAGMTHKKNISYNLSLTNWLKWKYPSLRITDSHYGMPPFTQRIGTFQENIDDDTTVMDIYIKYQTLAGLMHLRSDEYPEQEQRHLKNIYTPSNLEWNRPTGIDDPGHYDVAYRNPENPDLPKHLRAYSYDAKSTDNSLAWLVFHVEYA